ncbi:phage tail protein [Rugamonas sp. FT107W]|uniref:Phage tail protein n=1 Tax=Duganella vulcania TaxID=2692166 RepID=A0A845HRU2_9BURK|nr:tail fiber protein [Duganella vulcania]MYN20173.1 phage tail protein [Duganella vulcania]
MADPFVAEIRLFAGNFAPTGWATCDGQLLPISQNTALFSLLGTQYGGDGKSTFALPNLRQRAPLRAGQGAGLTERFQGETGGAATVTVNGAQTPAHAHQMLASGSPANTTSPNGNTLAVAVSPTPPYIGPAPLLPMGGAVLAASTGGGQAHNNVQPYLELNFIIALQGIFPPRS